MTTKTDTGACGCWVNQRRAPHDGHCCLSGDTMCAHTAPILTEAYRLAGATGRNTEAVWEATALTDRSLYIAMAYQAYVDGEVT